MFVSARAEALSYSAVKLFSKYSNLCEKPTSTSDRQTDRQTDDLAYCGITALCVASRGKNWSVLVLSPLVQCSGYVVGRLYLLHSVQEITRVSVLVFLIPEVDEISADTINWNLRFSTPFSTAFSRWQ